MGFEISPRAEDINNRLKAFMDEHIYPREKEYEEFTGDHNNLWQYPDWYQGLKDEAKKTGPLESVSTGRIQTLEPRPHQSRNCPHVRNHVQSGLVAADI